LAVVAIATGCGGEEQSLTLEEWASSVCVAYDGYVTPDVRSAEKELASIRSAVFGIDNPDDYDIDFKNPSKLRKDAPELISEGLLLEQIANLQAADRNVIGKLEALERPPDTEAGRLARSLLADEIKRIRENLDYLRQEVETSVKAYTPADSTPMGALLALDRVFGATAYPYSGAFRMANMVGLVGAVKKRTGGEILRAFKDADGCRSWSKDLVAGERQGDLLKPKP